MTRELFATVEIKLAVPETTDPRKITPGYLTGVLNQLIDIDEEGSEPFAFRGVTVERVGPPTCKVCHEQIHWSTSLGRYFHDGGDDLQYDHRADTVTP